MELALNIHKEILIADLETYYKFFCMGFYNPDTKEWTDFEISRRKNDLNKFVKFYTTNPANFLVTYNGVGYDQQVLQYIVSNYEKWYDLSGEQIAGKIKEFSNLHIDNMKYGLPNRYREDNFSMYPLDLMLVNHFDNKAKRVSLKWIEFMMNMKVEECSIPFDQLELTDAEMDEIIAYNHHDILATLGLLYITIGEPDRVMEINGGIPVPHLSDYKGMNKLQDRYDILEETGLVCFNWSDVKIGEEWNALDYMKATGIEDRRALHPDRPHSEPYGKPFSKFFPKTMQFRTPQLKDFIKKLGKETVKPYILKTTRNGKKKKEKQTFSITIGETEYTIAKGGIHSCEKNRAIIPLPGFIYRDADVGSQYPNSIVKLEIYAPHLKDIVLGNFKGKIELRITYKSKAKELKSMNLTIDARKFESVQGLLKLCLNGGYYGKLGQEGSWLHFPEGLLKVCMGNQIEILMAIEAMELEGFKVLSGNTDGFTTMFPADKEDKYKEVCKWWEDTVGNHTLGKLEYVDYTKMFQRNINNYIGEYIDEKGNLKVKKKGSFVTTYGSPGCELNKDKSERIIPLALEQYFIKGKDPIEFIKNHDVIYDFLVGFKTSSGNQMHYEEEWEQNGEVKSKVHNKLVVCYVSTDGNILKKKGIDKNGEDVNDHCFAKDDKAPELGQPKVTYFNTPFFPKKFSDYNIDYNYYIYQTLKIIDDIEGTKKVSKFLEKLRPVQQISMF